MSPASLSFSSTTSQSQTEADNLTLQTQHNDVEFEPTPSKSLHAFDSSRNSPRRLLRQEATSCPSLDAHLHLSRFPSSHSHSRFDRSSSPEYEGGGKEKREGKVGPANSWSSEVQCRLRPSPSYFYRYHHSTSCRSPRHRLNSFESPHPLPHRLLRNLPRFLPPWTSRFPLPS